MKLHKINWADSASIQWIEVGPVRALINKQRYNTLPFALDYFPVLCSCDPEHQERRRGTNQCVCVWLIGSWRARPAPGGVPASGPWRDEARLHHSAFNLTWAGAPPKDAVTHADLSRGPGAPLIPALQTLTPGVVYSFPSPKWVCQTSQCCSRVTVSLFDVSIHLELLFI